MQGIQLIPCDCPLVDELEGLNLSREINPTKYPSGTPAHDSAEFLCEAIWIQNPSTSLTLYFGFGAANASDLSSCMQIAPGQDKFWTVITEASKLVAIAKPKIRPYRVRLQATGNMTAVVVLF